MVASDKLENKGKSYKANIANDLAVIEVLGLSDDGDFLGCVVAENHKLFEATVIIICQDPALEKRIHISDRWVAKLTFKDSVIEASLVRQLKVEQKCIIGILQGDGKDLQLVPLDKRNRNTYRVNKDSIESSNAREGDLVEAEIIDTVGKRDKNVAIQKVLSRSEDFAKHLSEIAIHNFDLPKDFSVKILSEAEAATLPKASNNRKDIREIPLVTIDDIDARDHDDAVYVEPDDDPNNEGGWKILVAIADVSYFVKSGSELDYEARKRGNSVYFPDQVIPMLPERLSNNLCSLRPMEDRPALAVWMRITKRGKLLSKKFFRALMKSHAKLTYDGVHEFHETGKSQNIPEHIDDRIIHDLYGAYAVLQRARTKRGTLELDLPEQKVILNDQGRIEKVIPRHRHDSHRLIEEFMILANVAAAEFISGHNLPCLFRAHDKPREERVEELRLFLMGNDISAKIGRGQVVLARSFTHILKMVKDLPIAPAINQLVLRSQSQALYSPDHVGHFGLNLAQYAHFTSPIRRYADLTIHRAIISLIEQKQGMYPYSYDDLQTIGQEISDSERLAAKAERETMDRYTAAFLEGKEGETVEARISGITDFAIFVALEETGADGILPLRNLIGDYFNFDQKNHCVIGRRSRKKLTLGDLINVRLESANAITGSIIFSARFGSDKKRSTRRPMVKKPTGRKRKL